MTIELLAEGPLSLGRPLVLRPPRLSAVVIGEGIVFAEGLYSEPVELSWRLHRDGTFVGDEGYIPVASDEGRRFMLVEMARGARGITWEVSEQVGTDVAIAVITPVALAPVVAGDVVQEVVTARGAYQHPSGITMKRLIFFVDGAEVPAGFVLQAGEVVEVFEIVETNSGATRTFPAGSRVVAPSSSAVVTYLGEPVRYLGAPVNYIAP